MKGQYYTFDIIIFNAIGNVYDCHHRSICNRLSNINNMILIKDGVPLFSCIALYRDIHKNKYE